MIPFRLIGAHWRKNTTRTVLTVLSVTLAVLLFGLFLLGALGWWFVPKALRILDEQQAWARGVPVIATTTKWRVKSTKGVFTHEVEVQVPGAGRLARTVQFEFDTLFVAAARVEHPEVRVHPDRADVVALGPAMELIRWRWAASGLLVVGLLLGGGASTWAAFAMIRELARARRLAFHGQPVLLEVLGKTPPKAKAKEKEWTWHLRTPAGGTIDAKFAPPHSPLWVERERLALGLWLPESGLPPLVVRDDVHPLALSPAARDALLAALRGG